MTVTLGELRPGQQAVVRALGGGRGMVQRLEALGVRPGKTVRMVSSQFMAGPVTVSIDGREVAMGRGIASRVLVEPLSD
jgi:ferrous iron transport protein A